MNILFLTIGLPNLNNQGGGLYADIIQELQSRGHKLTAIAPSLTGDATSLQVEGGVNVLRVKMDSFVGNIPTWKKIGGVLMMNPRYKKAYKRFLWNEKFDWVMMPTPPSSMIDVVDNIVRRTGAKFYLVLRDIHPESKRRFPTEETMARTDVYDDCKVPYCASKLMYWYFYKKSQKCYRMANLIGCMSPQNIEFVKKIAPGISAEKVVLLPNWYKETRKLSSDSEAIRKQYGFENKFIAIYGGTIGEGQAIWNIASLAKHNINRDDVVFLVVGRGNKMPALKKMAEMDHLTNMHFVEFMPRDAYEALLSSADLGLISIDEKFSVPTCPSKVIGYMALHQPVLAMINDGNDFGEFYIDASGCGLWSSGMDYDKMFKQFDWFVEHKDERIAMGEKGYQYFLKMFSVEKVTDIMESQIK